MIDAIVSLARRYTPHLLVMILMAVGKACFAQLLSPELLSTVPITPLQAESQLKLDECRLSASFVWRDKLVLYDSNAHRFLLVRPNVDNKVETLIDLPKEVPRFACLSRPQLVAEIHGIAPKVGQATLFVLELRGDGKGGYRVPTPLPSQIVLRYPEGSVWNEHVSQVAVSPTGDGFWVSCVEDGVSPPRATWLWRFSLRRNGRRVAGAIAIEKLRFPEVPIAEDYTVAALAWWPSGLLVALNLGDATPTPRPMSKYAALVFLPWGGGLNPQVLVPRFARGHEVMALADSPSTLYILLRRIDDKTYAVASIPKLFPNSR